MTDFSRRAFVVAGSAAGGLIVSGATNKSHAACAGAVVVIGQSNFRFAIHGLTDNLVGLRTLSGGKLIIGTKVDPRGEPGNQLSYGEPRWGDIQFTVQQGPGMVKLRIWADKTTKMGGCGNVLRRDCSLYLLAPDKTTVMRTINYFGCYPVSCDGGDNSISSEIKSITFTCNVDRIEETKG